MPVTMNPTVETIQGKVRKVISLGAEIDEKLVVPGWSNVGRDVDPYATVQLVSSFGDENPEWQYRNDEDNAGVLFASASAVMQEWYNVNFYRKGATNSAEQTRLWLRSPLGREQLRIRGLEAFRIGPVYDETEVVRDFAEERAAFTLTVTFIRTLFDQVEAMQAANIQLVYQESPYEFTGPWNDTEELGFRTYTTLPALADLTAPSLPWDTDPTATEGTLPTEVSTTLSSMNLEDLYLAVRLPTNIRSMQAHGDFYTTLIDYRVQFLNTNIPGLRKLSSLAGVDEYSSLYFFTEGDFDEKEITSDYLYWLKTDPISTPAQTIIKPQRRLLDIRAEEETS